MAGETMAQEAAILITNWVARKKAANDAGGVPLPDSARACTEGPPTWRGLPLLSAPKPDIEPQST